jgi:Taurine catabolism dioxygenase TauD, TfdA family
MISGKIERFGWADLQERPQAVAEALTNPTGNGAVLIAATSGEQESMASLKKRVMQFLPHIGEPILVYKQHELWKHIGVSLSLEPDRVGGIGDIPLHIDLVNASRPPDFIVFMSEREDEAGGGRSVISPFRPVLESLDDLSLEELSSIKLKEGRFFDLVNVGVEVNPFPILEMCGREIEWVRFSAKSRTTVFHGKIQALEKFQKLMIANEIEFDLKGGEALIINQRLAAHGRRRLGPVQDRIPGDRRRSLYQLFVRGNSHSPSKCFVYPARTRV